MVLVADIWHALTVFTECACDDMYSGLCGDVSVSSSFEASHETLILLQRFSGLSKSLLKHMDTIVTKDISTVQTACNMLMVIKYIFLMIESLAGFRALNVFIKLVYLVKCAA